MVGGKEAETGQYHQKVAIEHQPFSCNIVSFTQLHKYKCSFCAFSREGELKQEKFCLTPLEKWVL